MQLEIKDHLNVCWIKRCRSPSDILRSYPNGHDFEYEGDIALCDDHNAEYEDLREEEWLANREEEDEEG